MSGQGRTISMLRLSMNRLEFSANTQELRSMFSFGRAPAILAAAIFVLVTISGTVCHGAKASGGRTKVKVPANILKGAAVTKGRAFYSSYLPEESLAGIRLSRPAKEILVKWGNPSRITVGTSTALELEMGAAPMQAGPPYMPSAGGMFGPPSLPGMGRMPGQVYAMPGMGFGAPMPSALPRLGGQPETSAVSVVLTQEEVTWTYDLPNGITLEFIITDGLITQITAGGIGPWKLSKTRTGLQLGDTYKLVLWVCGYPEAHEYAGRFLRARYVNKNRALFTFLQNRLVGVTIALVPQDLR